MNTKRVLVCLALVGLLAVGGQAFAEFGTIDDVPAATLLLPYFEVAPDKSIDTFFSVNNASAAPALAHVTVWSDQSVPVLDFDVYLTGYDVQSFSLHRVLVDGILPSTGAAVSNEGQFSLSNANTINSSFAGCGDGTPGGGPPFYNPLSSTFLAVIEAALTGQSIPAGAAVGDCAGADYGDGILRGYVTVDTVDECSQVFPNNDDYFAEDVDGNPIGIANDVNVLWGDWFIVDEANAFASGETMVHIEAEDAPNQAVCDPQSNNPYTFYCRYGTDPGADNREALGSLYGARYLNGGPFNGGTDFVVWRDPDIDNAPFTCGAVLSLTQNQIVVFDEEENPIVSQRGPSGFEPEDENPFLYETQRVAVGGPLGPTVSQPFGWIYLNLNGALGTRTIHNQAWVHVVLKALDLYSVGYDTIQFNNLSVGGGDFDGWSDNVCLGNNGSITPCS